MLVQPLSDELRAADELQAELLRSQERFAEVCDRLETMHTRLTEAQDALAKARQKSLAYESLEERFIALQRRADAAERQLEQNPACAERLAEAEIRLVHARQTIERLSEQCLRVQPRLHKLEAAFAGTGPTGLAIARRLARLANRFPRTAAAAKGVLRSAHRLRRAA